MLHSCHIRNVESISLLWVSLILFSVRFFSGVPFCSEHLEFISERYMLCCCWHRIDIVSHSHWKCVCVWIPFFYSSVFLGCFGPCCVLNNEFPGEMLSFCLLSLSLPSYILNVYTMVITDVPYCQCEMCIIQSRKLCACMLEPFLLIEMQRPALLFSTSFIHSVCCWWWWCSCRVAWLNILPSLIQQIQQWLWLT